MREEEKEQDLTRLQLLEQSIQALLLQKQSFQLELTETNSALEELKKKPKEEVFKIVGSIMIKSSKAELEQELNQKKELLELRLKSIEQQENELTARLKQLREKIIKEIKK